MLGFEDEEKETLKISACINSWHGQRSEVDCPEEEPVWGQHVGLVWMRLGEAL